MDNVKLKIRGEQKDITGESNVIETTAKGRHCIKNGKHYILYEDHLGTNAVVSNVLKFNETSVTLLRHGGVEMEQRFIPGKAERSTYQTPEGGIELEIKTDELNVDCSGIPGEIYLKYHVRAGGVLTGTNELRIYIYKDDVNSCLTN